MLRPSVCSVYQFVQSFFVVFVNNYSLTGMSTTCVSI